MALFDFLLVGKAIFVTTLVGLGAIGQTVQSGVPNALSVGLAHTSSSNCTSGLPGTSPSTNSANSGSGTGSLNLSTATCPGNAQGGSAYQHCKEFSSVSTISTSSTEASPTSSAQSSLGTRPGGYGALVSEACSRAGKHGAQPLPAASQGRPQRSMTSTTALNVSVSTTSVPQSSVTRSGPPTQIPAGQGRGAGYASRGRGGH